MSQYVRRRLLLVLPTLVGATLTIFFVLRLLPGDVALLLLVGPDGEGNVNQETLLALRHRLGTDRPIHEQYLSWVSRAVRGDFGDSLVTDRPVVDELARRLPVTVELAVLSTLVAALIGIPIGVVMALRQDTWVDYVLRVVTIAGFSVPSFFLGTIVILLLVGVFRWLPPLGYSTLLEDPLQNLRQVVWPILIMGYFGSAVLGRLTRSTMLETLREEYITTARAKGLGARRIALGHALRNAILPTYTFAGVIFVGALNGTVVMEYIFVIPGIGSGLVDAISSRDYPMVQSTVALITLIVLLANLAIDLTYTLLDPRITFGRSN